MASEYTPDWLLFNPVNANPSQPKNIEVTFGYDNYYTLNANTTHYWCAWDKIDQWSELVVDSPSSGVAEPVFFFFNANTTGHCTSPQFTWGSSFHYLQTFFYICADDTFNTYYMWTAPWDTSYAYPFYFTGAPSKHLLPTAFL